MVTHHSSRQSRDLSSMNAEMSGRFCSARQHAIRVRRHMQKQRQPITLKFKRDSACTARKSVGANSLDFAQE